MFGVDEGDRRKGKVGGKQKGKLTTFDKKNKGSLDLDQVPSFIIDKSRKSMPLQIQNLISWLTGERAGFDMLFNSLGAGIGTAYDRSGRPKRPNEKPQPFF